MKGWIELTAGKDRLLINVDNIVCVWEERKKKNKFLNEVASHIETTTGSFTVNEFYEEIITKIMEARK